MATDPEIQLDLTLSDRFFDLAEESIDIALRVVDEAPMNVYARQICRIGWSLVGSPAYFAKRCKPADISELAALDCLSDAKMSPRET